MISVSRLTKRYGKITAVDDVSFEVTPGSIVGFVGRNGAGKTSTLRILVGLAKATSGEALINGKPYRKLKHPLKTVGVAFDPFALDPRISGKRHLIAQALRAGISKDRIDVVLELVGLTDAANRRINGYSLGMRQRLNLASAMLGDPKVLILDEPTNGLDPQGHRWLRNFLRERADEGRAVLFSSHVLSEVTELVDRVVVIARGRVVADGTLQDIVGTEDGVHVKAERSADLQAQVELLGATVVHLNDDGLEIKGITARKVGEVARDQSIALHELIPTNQTLEQAFVKLTGEEGGPS